MTGKRMDLIASLDALEIGREKREKELEDIDREQEESGKDRKIQREVEKGREAAELLERSWKRKKSFREEEAVADALEDVITEAGLRWAEAGEEGGSVKTEDQLSATAEEAREQPEEQLAEQEEIQANHENNASLIGEKEKRGIVFRNSGQAARGAVVEPHLG